MERNADEYTGGSSGGAGAAGSTSGDVSGSAGYGAGAGASTASSSFGSTPAGDTSGGIADRARDLAGNAKDKLAGALEAGADKLRQRGGRGQLSGSPGSTDVAVTSDGVSQVTERVAGGMQATADWLREADLDTMRAGVERQVKEHPGRTLLIAVGLGYLLGKAFRK